MVPVYVNDSQHQATLDAGAITGWNVVRIINKQWINLLGVKQISIVVNKMVCETAGYKQASYDAFANEIITIVAGDSRWGHHPLGCGFGPGLAGRRTSLRKAHHSC